MIASRVSRDVLEQAAQAVGVRADIASHSATRHRVKLYPVVRDEQMRPPRFVGIENPRMRRWTGARGDSKYQRESVGYGTAGRRVHAVCWHGFRDYFREVYMTTPEAWFRTSVAMWRGAADFEARFRVSGYRNIGPPVAPVMMASACRCLEAGSVGGTMPSLDPLDGADDVRVPTALITAPDISESRWADVNRKFCELFRPRAAS